MKIGIMGYYPPPIGGISMHVKRLERLLIEKQIDYKIYAIGAKDEESESKVIYSNRRKWSTRYIFQKKEDILHCHTMGWLEKLYYLVVAKLSGKKVMYTFHSFRDKYDTLGFRNKIAYKLVLKFGDAFIFVGKDDYDYVMKEVVPHYERKKFSYLPGFIAPVDDGVKLPKDITSFMAQHKVMISANASNMKFYNEQDLYGIDMCVDLLEDVRTEYDAGLVFLLPNISDQAYYEDLNQRIIEKNLGEHFLFVHDEMELYKVIQKSTVFVRPTNTDGDAISIRESLFFGVPVVASDVISRPDGTVLFENRKREDFYLKVKQVIEGDFKTSTQKGEDFGLQIMDIYHKLYRGK